MVVMCFLANGLSPPVQPPMGLAGPCMATSSQGVQTSSPLRSLSSQAMRIMLLIGVCVYVCVGVCGCSSYVFKFYTLFKHPFASHYEMIGIVGGINGLGWACTGITLRIKLCVRKHTHTHKHTHTRSTSVLYCKL